MLHWFARLWEIDRDDYWGYITNCGTEGNLHGILTGRENLPDGVLYASSESHYSVFKAARMYRMDAERVRQSPSPQFPQPQTTSNNFSSSLLHHGMDCNGEGLKALDSTCMPRFCS